jgi:hypothetical protein
LDFAAFQEKIEKDTRFFAFSPKASKSRFVQAGLLTHPLFKTFPFVNRRTVALFQKVIQDLQQRELYRNYQPIGSPVSLLILIEEPIRLQMYIKEFTDC